MFIPLLQKRVPVHIHYSLDHSEFPGPEFAAVRHTHGIEPKLGRRVITLYVNTRFS